MPSTSTLVDSIYTRRVSAGECYPPDLVKSQLRKFIMLKPVHQGEHPDIARLREFHPLNELDKQALMLLAQNLTIQHASKKTVLIHKGDTDDSMLYLLEGSVVLEATDGARQRIRAHEESARSPIARLRPCKYNVVTETAVEYLKIPSSLIGSGNGPSSELTTAGIELYEVVDESEADQQAAEDQLAFQLYEDLNSNQLLPSLPDVAIRVGQAVNHDLADANRVARVIENDPVITAKLIKVANSARYGGRATIDRLPDAIARIGMNTTCQWPIILTPLSANKIDPPGATKNQLSRLCFSR